MRGCTTAGKLAEELGVSDRTIYRDLSVLSAYRPISAISGRYGGIYITDPRALNRPILRQEELALLRRIAKSSEQAPTPLLSPSDLELLREMIRYYSGTTALSTLPQNQSAASKAPAPASPLHTSRDALISGDDTPPEPNT